MPCSITPVLEIDVTKGPRSPQNMPQISSLYCHLYEISYFFAEHEHVFLFCYAWQPRWDTGSEWWWVVVVGGAMPGFCCCKQDVVIYHGTDHNRPKHGQFPLQISNLNVCYYLDRSKHLAKKLTFKSRCCLQHRLGTDLLCTTAWCLFVFSVSME